MLVGCRARGVTHTKEARGDGVDGVTVEFVEVAFVVDEHGALKRFFGERVVADAVVGEVIENFEREEEAWGWGVGIPREYGAVDDLDMFGVASGGCGLLQTLLLKGGEGGGNFNDFEFCAGIDFRVGITDVIEDVEHQCAIAGPHFVDY